MKCYQQFLSVLALLFAMPILNACQISIDTFDVEERQVEKVVEEIHRLETARIEALVNADIETLDRIMANDFLLTNPFSGVITKAEYIDAVEAKIANYLYWTIEESEVDVYADVAIITYDSHIVLKVGETYIDSPHRHTDVYEKRNGQWQAISSHTTGTYLQEAELPNLATPSPRTTVLLLADARNAGDVEATLALYTEDGEFSVEPPPPDRVGLYKGQDELRDWYEWLTPQNQVVHSEILDIDGDTVTVREVYTDETLQSMGLDEAYFDVVYVLRDGKIASHAATFTPESLAELEAALENLEEK